jgi:hypothetical protein
MTYQHAKSKPFEIILTEFVNVAGTGHGYLLEGPVGELAKQCLQLREALT